MERVAAVVRLGFIRFREAAILQEQIASELKRTDGASTRLGAVLLAMEHPHVYTIGIRQGAISDEEAAKAIANGAEIERSGRGGLATYHGPGQLVVWPVVRLACSVRQYVALLEEAISNAVRQQYGINAGPVEGLPGVWVGDDKLAALGVRASRRVSTHGIAINACTDLSRFDLITPCGLPDKGVTSLSKLTGRNVPTDEIENPLLESLCRSLSLRCIHLSWHDLPLYGVSVPLTGCNVPILSHTSSHTRTDHIPKLEAVSA